MKSTEIKKMLKDKGIDTKNISVKCSPCGYSESIRVTLKDENINKKEVEKIVNNLESYERDEKTGEILEGGNTYVFVEYDYKIIEEVNKKYNNDLKLKIDKLKNEYITDYKNGCLLTIFRNDKTSLLIGQHEEQEELYLNGSQIIFSYDYLAGDLLRRGILKEVLNYE